MADEDEVGVDTRVLEPWEARVVGDLPVRLGTGRPLGAAHRLSLLERARGSVVELRRAGRGVARLHALRLPYDALEERPDWERLSDGGLGRTSDGAGELLWVFGIAAEASLSDAEVARAVVRLAALVRRPSLGLVIAVGEPFAALAMDAVGTCERATLAGHFPLTSGRGDAVALHVPAAGARRSASRASTLRAAAVQLDLRAEASRGRSLARFRAEVDRAAEEGARLVVLPEMLTTEWLTHEAEAPSLHEAVRRVDDHRERFLEAMRDAARANAVTLVAGSHFTRSSRGLLNVSTVFGPDGARLGQQEKLHPTPYEAEALGVVPGRGLRTFDVDGTRFAVALCYDVEFPETARRAAELGVDLLVVPYNTETRAGHHRVARTASARAVECEAYVLTAGVVGAFEHAFDVEAHHAESAAFTPSDVGFPDDGVLARATPGVASRLVVDLDVEALRRHRARATVRPFRDRTDLAL